MLLLFYIGKFFNILYLYVDNKLIFVFMLYLFFMFERIKFCIWFLIFCVFFVIDLLGWVLVLLRKLILFWVISNLVWFDLILLRILFKIELMFFFFNCWILFDIFWILLKLINFKVSIFLLFFLKFVNVEFVV